VSVFEELALPVVEEGGADVEFIAEIGDGDAFEEMSFDDSHLFVRLKVTLRTLFGHKLTESRQSFDTHGLPCEQFGPLSSEGYEDSDWIFVARSHTLGCGRIVTHGTDWPVVQRPGDQSFEPTAGTGEFTVDYWFKATEDLSDTSSSGNAFLTMGVNEASGFSPAMFDCPESRNRRTFFSWPTLAAESRRRSKRESRTATRSMDTTLEVFRAHPNEGGDRVDFAPRRKRPRTGQ
jgi:hypothetical protein